MNGLDARYIALAARSAPWWARKRRAGWGERLGRIAPLPAPAPGRPRVLLHAVSVGEVGALRELVPILAGGAEVVVSATTDTGLARARELFAPSCAVVRYPLDFSRSVGRFLDAVRPDAVGLVELELWPNFVGACRRRGIGLAVINGRLSARSFRGYRRLRPFFRPIFASLDRAAVQDEEYAQRFRAMGVLAERCVVTGSMKWDAARIADAVPGAERLAAELGLDRGGGPLIVAGSTGPGEEALLHAACPPGARLLCAPRKPERFDEAAAALPGCVRRSAPGRALDAGAPPDRFLLDTIGELRAAYSLADVVVVGRSFGDLFGSDPIEPIALGRPTVIGPAVSDFATIVGALEREGGIVRVTRESLGRVLADLLADPVRRATLVRRGRECIRGHQGASARHADLLMALARRRPPGR